MISKKVAMLGMWGVGKTSLVQQFVNSIYDDKYLSTVGVKVDKKVVTAGDMDLTMMLWDIAGAEDHFSVPVHYVKGAAGYLLVLDGTRKQSLDVALDLVNMVQQDIGKLPFVVALNKSDLACELTLEEVTAAVAPFDAPCFATSAKTGENVEAAFAALAGALLPRS